MQVELNIRRLLADCKLDRRGIVGELAAVLRIHRHSARKLLNGELKSVSLETLGHFCGWLRSKAEVPVDLLLPSLFAFRPDALWDAVARTEHVTIHLGEHQQTEEAAAPARLWISRMDASVADAIADQLRTFKGTNEQPPRVRQEYVPFHYAHRKLETRRKYFEEDGRRAVERFRLMRSRQANAANILIGSCQVNYLVECWIAELFGCPPFVPAGDEPLAPVHVRFRNPLSAIESCFGSLEAPPGHRGEAPSGIHYLGADGQWVACPWAEGREDAGVVVVSRLPSANTVDILMFGFSGRATGAMATTVVRNTDPFWPPYFELKGRQIGMYICRFTSPGAPGPDGENGFGSDMPEVIRLDGQVLRKCLGGGTVIEDAERVT